jgi:formate hydrogenlyase subunit 3/multisubunit Na+/H+ antiporter MnhD subunit
MWEFISCSQNNKTVKSESAIIISGTIMFISGLVLFYSIQNDSDMDQLLRHVKHAGTFVGLAGIGVMLAGFLLRLMGKEQPPIEENYGE